jgi:hypothetical protein
LLAIASEVKPAHENLANVTQFFGMLKMAACLAFVGMCGNHRGNFFPTAPTVYEALAFLKRGNQRNMLTFRDRGYFLVCQITEIKAIA